MSEAPVDLIIDDAVHFGIELVAVTDGVAPNRRSVPIPQFELEESQSMPVLPLIDLLILTGWSCLAVGGVLKAIAVTTSYRPEIMTMGPIQFLMLSGILLLFALTLAARTWVKIHEPALTAKRRALATLRAVNTAGTDFDYGSEPPRSAADLPPRGVAGS